MAVVGGLFYVILMLRWPVERPLAYWPIDDRTLEVVFLDAPDLNCTIAAVDESSDAVRIYAQCREPVISGPHTSMAQKYVLQVILQAPLGSRVVYDGTGNRGVLCQAPGLDCVAPQ